MEPSFNLQTYLPPAVTFRKKEEANRFLGACSSLARFSRPRAGLDNTLEENIPRTKLLGTILQIPCSLQLHPADAGSSAPPLLRRKTPILLVLDQSLPLLFRQAMFGLQEVSKVLLVVCNLVQICCPHLVAPIVRSREVWLKVTRCHPQV